MSISRRQLEALGEPFGESATRQKLGGGYICGGGDSAPSAPDKTTTTTTTIPDWAKPYAEKMLGQASAITDISQNPYQAYGGQQTAGFNPMQQQAFGNIQQMSASPATGAGMDIAAGAAQQAQQYGQYQPQDFGNQFQGAQFNPMGIQNYANVQNPNLQNFQMQQPGDVYGARARSAQLNAAPNFSGMSFQGPQDVSAMQAQAERVNAPNLQNLSMQAAGDVGGPNLQNYQMGPASDVASKDFTDPNVASQYMNPYTQNVVDVQQREAQRAADIATTGRNAQAVGAGAFGGSRQAIMDAEAARNLATQKGDIQAQGLNAAYGQAQQAFQQDQARQLQAQQANQQAGLTVGQQNLGANLQTQGLGAQLGQQSALANQANQQQANLQNLSAGLQTQGLAAQTGMQAQQANQQTGLQALLANQQTGLQAGLANQQMQYNTGLQNAQFGQQAGMANQALQGQYGLQQGQFNQAANLQNAQMRQQAQLANQQTGLATGQQNLQAMLGVQQLGAGQSLQAQQANQQAALQAQGQGLQQNLAGNQQAAQNAQLAAQYGLAGQQATEQSRQYGANLGLQGIQQQLAAAGQMGALGQQDYTQNMGINSAQQQAGAQMQALQQQQMTNQYNNFLNQQRYPYQQLGYMSDVLRGTPSSNTTAQIYQAAPNMASQIGGLGMGAYGLTKAFGAKAGGEIKGYAGGGEIRGFSDGGIANTSGSKDDFSSKINRYTQAALTVHNDPDKMKKVLSGLDPLSQALVMGQVNNQKAHVNNNQSLQQQPPKTTVLSEMGLGGLNSGVMENAQYANGGIIAFEEGGAATPFERAIGWGSAEERTKNYEAAEKKRKEDLEAQTKVARNYADRAGFLGMFMNQTDEERAAAQKAYTAGTNPLGNAAPTPAVTPPPTVTPPPAPVGGPVKGPVGGPVRGPVGGPAAAPSTGLGDSAFPLMPFKARDVTAETAAFKKERAEAAPSDMEDQIKLIREQGQQALKDRDSDRWMAVAMGGFAAAAGKSRFFMQNMAEGLGLTTKEINAVNKEFRNGEAARSKAVRAEQLADRQLKLGNLDAVEKYKAEAEKYNQLGEYHQNQTAAALANTKAHVDIAKAQQQTEQQKIGIMSGQRADMAKDTHQRRLDELHAKVTKNFSDANPMMATLQQKYASGKASNEEIKQLENFYGLRDTEIKYAMGSSGRNPSGFNFGAVNKLIGSK
jgi:hypothetical protein